MANGFRTGDPRGFNKGRSSKFRAGFQVRQTPEEGWRTYRPKRRGNNNKDEDNSPKTLHDKKHRDSSKKFRQLVQLVVSKFRNEWIALWGCFSHWHYPTDFVCVCVFVSDYIYIYIYILFFCWSNETKN